MQVTFPERCRLWQSGLQHQTDILKSRVVSIYIPAWITSLALDYEESLFIVIFNLFYTMRSATVNDSSVKVRYFYLVKL